MGGLGAWREGGWACSSWSSWSRGKPGHGERLEKIARPRDDAEADNYPDGVVGGSSAETPPFHPFRAQPTSHRGGSAPPGRSMPQTPREARREYAESRHVVPRWPPSISDSAQPLLESRFGSCHVPTSLRFEKLPRYAGPASPYVQRLRGHQLPPVSGSEPLLPTESRRHPQVRRPTAGFGTDTVWQSTSYSAGGPA